PRPASARQDREGPGEPGDHRHGARRRLQGRPGAMRAGPRAVGLMLTAPLRRVWLWWTHSLSLRVVSSTLLVGLVSVAALGAYVTNEIRDGLVDKRVGRILAESARDVTAAQEQVNASTAESEGDLQQLVNDVLESLGVVGGDTRGLLLLPDPSNKSDIPILVGTSDLELVGVISRELRDAVEP